MLDRRVKVRRSPFIIGLLLRAVRDMISAEELLRSGYNPPKRRAYLRDVIRQGMRAKKVLEEVYGINVDKYIEMWERKEY